MIHFRTVSAGAPSAESPGTNAALATSTCIAKSPGGVQLPNSSIILMPGLPIRGRKYRVKCTCPYHSGKKELVS